MARTTIPGIPREVKPQSAVPTATYCHTSVKLGEFLRGWSWFGAGTPFDGVGVGSETIQKVLRSMQVHYYRLQTYRCNCMEWMIMPSPSGMYGRSPRVTSRSSVSPSVSPFWHHLTSP